MERRIIGQQSEFCLCAKEIRFYVIEPNADGGAVREPAEDYYTPEFCQTCGRRNPQPLEFTFVITNWNELQNANQTNRNLAFSGKGERWKVSYHARRMARILCDGRETAFNAAGTVQGLATSRRQSLPTDWADLRRCVKIEKARIRILPFAFGFSSLSLFNLPVSKFVGRCSPLRPQPSDNKSNLFPMPCNRIDRTFRRL